MGLQYPRLLALAGVLLGLLGSAGAVRAQFDIDEPEAEQGEVEVEYQGDYHFGNPRRQVSIGPDGLIADENEVLRQRHVLGLGLGLTDYFKLGIEVEFEQERFDDPDSVAQANAFDDLEATEIQIEGTAVLVPLKRDGFAAAAFLSYGAALDDGPSTFIFGPIFKIKQGPWSATTNTYFVKNFGGGEVDDDGTTFRDGRWDFEYKWQLKYEASASWAFALEGFGTVNRLGDSGRRSEAVELFGDQDQHRLGPVVYYTFKRPRGTGTSSLKDANGDDDAPGARAGANDDEGDNGDDDEGTAVTAGLGVLFGLNETTSDVALKWSLEVQF